LKAKRKGSFLARGEGAGWGSGRGQKGITKERKEEKMLRFIFKRGRPGNNTLAGKCNRLIRMEGPG